MIEYDHWSDVPDQVWVWPNFTPEELASKGDGSIRLREMALDMLQILRDEMGPLIINSAYRDPLYNARIGGAPMSRHKFGEAFDIAIRDYDRYELAQKAREVGFTGFGYYQTFLHVDIHRPRFWFGGKRSKQKWNRLATS
jgi:hypothetical protein